MQNNKANSLIGSKQQTMIKTLITGVWIAKQSKATQRTQKLAGK